MKEKILEFLKGKKLHKEELENQFKEDITSFLDELVKSGEVIFYNGRYGLPSLFNIYLGEITSVKDYFAFVTVNEVDYYISKYDMHGALLNDLVYVRKIKSHGESDSVEVLQIVERKYKEIVGEIKNVRGSFVLDVLGISLKDYKFLIKKSSISLIPHTIARAKIAKINEDYSIVTPIEIIGFKNDPGVDISRIILSHNAPLVFPNKVLLQVKDIPTSVNEEDCINRTDFRDRTIVTIDGEDARDFDDAVEVTYKNGIYRIGVHIADVSHYVKENSPIDIEAELRSTSIYASDRVVPMLPFELSNGICSLNPHVDRLVQSVLFDMDRNGNIIKYSLHKGIIRSSARLTYTYVNKLLNEGIVDPKLDDKVNAMIPLLKEAADIIRNRRENLGAIDLSSNELKFTLNEDGSVEKVEKRVQDVGENLIEDLMIQANELVSFMMSERKVPFLYRIHENPKAKKMDEFRRLSSLLGYPCQFSSLTVTPSEIQMHLDTIDSKEKKDILSSYLLRAMAKARYSIVNHGHFGLALQDYTHFTSPIRRYPDLIVHRLIDYYFFSIGEYKSKEVIEKELLIHGENTSIREKRAQSIERDIDDLLAVKYMSKYIGFSFEGTIVSMTSNGMFVELENGIDGFLPFENMTGYFDFRPEIFMAVSRGTTYKLGDSVKVRLIDTDLDKCQITFSLIKERKRNIIKTGKKKRR